LIFDEPTQGIDVHAKEEIFGLVRRAASEQRGVIVISSDFSELVTLCTRVLVMHEGRVAGVLEGEDVSEAAIVQLAYQTKAAAVL
jgi:ribose transport system ATP-binding protein